LSECAAKGYKRCKCVIEIPKTLAGKLLRRLLQERELAIRVGAQLWLFSLPHTRPLASLALHSRTKLKTRPAVDGILSCSRSSSTQNNRAAAQVCSGL
jgi:hypothetical protein